jgi:hypothetical protein
MYSTLTFAFQLGDTLSHTSEPVVQHGVLRDDIFSLLVGCISFSTFFSFLLIDYLFYNAISCGV